MGKPVRIDTSFLTTHPQMQMDKGIDEKHVIVDKADHDLIIDFLNKDGDALSRLRRFANSQPKEKIG